jgi:iron complex outermembrane receptor protein
MTGTSRAYLSIVAATILLGAGLTAPSAIAQSGSAAAPNAGSPGLEEIVVTAQKKSEKLQTVPIAISAFSPAELAAYDTRNLEDLQIRTTGLVYTEASGSAQPYIRGIGVDLAAPGLEPPIAVYVDDVYWQRAFGNTFDLVDLEQVEVLKGPQGTLYGRDATGGAILLKTKNPTAAEEAAATFEYGNYDHAQGKFFVNEPITDDLRVRIAGQATNQDGFVNDPSIHRTYGGLEHYELRGKIDWTPSDILSFLFTSDYKYADDSAGTRQEITDAPGCLVCALTGAKPPSGFYDSKQGFVSDAETRSLSESLITKITLDDYDIKSVTAYQRHHFENGTDEGAMGSVLPFLNFFIATSGMDFMQQFQVSSKYSGPLNFLAGLDLQYSRDTIFDNLTGAAFEGPPPGDRVSAQGNVKTQSISGYGEGYYQFDDAWKLTLGARYNVDRKIFDTQNAPYTATLFGSTGTGASHNWYDLTPRAVLSYNVDGGNYYLSYSKGFKSGGFNLPTFTPEGNLGAEKLTSIEVGAKNGFFDNRVHTTVAVYHYSYKDIQVGIVDPVRGEIKQNAGSAETVGAEFDAEAAVTDQVTVGGGVAYLHARFTQFKDAAFYVPGPAGFTVVHGDLSGTPLTRAPDWTEYLNATYKFDLMDDWSGSLSVVGRYTSAYYFNPGGGGPLRADTQNAFGTMNLTGTLTPPDRQFKFGFYIDNLTGTHYRDLVDTGAEGIYGAAAPPTLFGFNVEYDFRGEEPPPLPPTAYVPPPVVAPAPPGPKSYLVFFDFNKSDLTSQATAIVDQAAKNADLAKVTQLEVTGHTDTVGSDAYNMRLSRRRAESVAAQLEKEGIPASEIAIFAKGKRDLLVPTADGVKEPQNRRVRIVYSRGVNS